MEQQESARRLREAAGAGDLDGVARLLEAGASPNGRDEQGLAPLDYAMAEWPGAGGKDHLALVRLLVAGGAHPGGAAPGGQTPLMTAAAEGLNEVVAYLHEQGARLDARMDSGANARHVLLDALAERKEAEGEEQTSEGQDAPDAVYEAYRGTAEYLISHGIDLGAALGGSGQTPLFLAAAYGFVEILDLILARQEEGLNARDAHGLTPLAHAARGGRVEVVASLLEAGADPDIQDAYGFAPLHQAAVQGDLETVEVLIAGGARPAPGLARDYGRYKAGSTPRDLARLARQRVVAGYLLRHGG